VGRKNFPLDLAGVRKLVLGKEFTLKRLKRRLDYWVNQENQKGIGLWSG